MVSADQQKKAIVAGVISLLSALIAAIASGATPLLAVLGSVLAGLIAWQGTYWTTNADATTAAPMTVSSVKSPPGNGLGF